MSPFLTMKVDDVESFHWPTGKESAVAFTFDLDAEEVWLSENPAYADQPVALSQGVYGPAVAVPLLLDLLARHDVRATFFVPGKVADRYPTTVKSISGAGHEIAHHGYRHDSPANMQPDEEERELMDGRRSLELLGCEVVGYRAPSWAVSKCTIELLQRHGFSYSSNFMDTVMPYRHADTDVLELPVHWILDDAAHFWFDTSSWSKKISTNSEAEEIWQAEFEGIAALGGIAVLTCHPQIIGRPGRLPLLERTIQRAKAVGSWVATCGEIANYLRGDETSAVEGDSQT